MIILGILFFLIFAVIVIFSFPQFSPIPYFPSNSKDIPLILKALRIRENQTIFDLGAGDGVVIFTAAEKALQNKLNTRFVAVEMNPVLAVILHIRRLMHPNKKHIVIIWNDMFKVNFPKYALTPRTVTAFIYVSPRYIPVILKAFQSHFNHFDLVSYFYPIDKNSKPHSQGIHSVFKKTF